MLAKVLETVLVQQLPDSVVSQMSDRKFGFQEKRCLKDAWRNVKDSVRSSNPKYVLSVLKRFFGYLSWTSANPGKCDPGQSFGRLISRYEVRECWS